MCVVAVNNSFAVCGYQKDCSLKFLYCFLADNVNIVILLVYTIKTYNSLHVLVVQ
jgi:hypothetical protein